MWGAYDAHARSSRPKVGERQVWALTGGAIANGRTKSIHSATKSLRPTIKVGRANAGEAMVPIGKTGGSTTAVAQQCPRQSQLCAGASCVGPCGDEWACSETADDESQS